MANALFWIVSIVMLAACWRVVTTRNLLHSVLAAFIVLISTAIIYFMLNAEFLGVVQILIYAGAVTILLLFVVMLTTTGPRFEAGFENKISPLMYLTSLLLFALLVFIVSNIRWPFTGETIINMRDVTTTLASRIFLEYLLPFEVASVLLLVALVGAVVLARKE